MVYLVGLSLPLLSSLLSLFVAVVNPIPSLFHPNSPSRLLKLTMDASLSNANLIVSLKCLHFPTRFKVPKEEASVAIAARHVFTIVRRKSNFTRESSVLMPHERLVPFFAESIFCAINFDRVI